MTALLQTGSGMISDRAGRCQPKKRLLVTFDDVMSWLGLTGVTEAWREEWDKAMAVWPEDIPFLAEGSIREASRYCGQPAELESVLQAAAVRIRGDERLARFAWFLRRIYFHDPIPPPDEVFAWPCVARPLGEQAALIPALVLLAGVPGVRALHAERGIPEAVTIATLDDIETWMRHFRRQTGYWGLQNMGWPTHHLSCRLFRLGRLQFMHIPFKGPLRAFTHQQTGHTVALWDSIIKIRRDGYVDGTNGISDGQARAPELTIAGGEARGYRVHPKGYVLWEPVVLSLAEWDQVLVPGDPVLDVHIPEGRRMDFDSCDDSLKQAGEFFPRYFPERPPAQAFACETWFFDAQYQKILPPSSNIVRFQRKFFLYPELSNDIEPFWRVFGGMPADLAAAPRETALKRAMLDFKLGGGLLRCAGGFCLMKGMSWGARLLPLALETMPRVSAPCSLRTVMRLPRVLWA